MSATIFAYCERGFDPGLVAEPLNLVSNAAFVMAAVIGLKAWRAGAHAGPAELALIGLVALIGLGSALFHAFATPLTRLADVAPIGLFMIAYLAFALRRFLGFGWTLVGLGVAVFIGVVWWMSTLRCGGWPCLRGSTGYIPALLALALVGGALWQQGHAAARPVLVAAALLAIALTFRTLDRALCPWTIVGGRALGTHALWHLVNGLLLGVLLVAAVRHGELSAARITR